MVLINLRSQTRRLTDRCRQEVRVTDSTSARTHDDIRPGSDDLVRQTIHDRRASAHPIVPALRPAMPRAIVGR